MTPLEVIRKVLAGTKGFNLGGLGKSVEVSSARVSSEGVLHFTVNYADMVDGKVVFRNVYCEIPEKSVVMREKITS